MNRLQRCWKFCGLMLGIGLMSGCLVNTQEVQTEQRLRELWPVVISPYLKEPLWMPELSYDAANALMVPMYCAFVACQDAPAEWQAEFHDFFNRFSTQFHVPLDENPLREAQFLYLASQYLLLTDDHPQLDVLHARLYEQILASVRHFWRERPAPHWAYASNFPNMEKRLRWRLAPSKLQYSYFAAVIDEEYFIMAIAADLARINVNNGRAVDPVLLEIMKLAHSTFISQGRFLDNGGWLMQPGVWKDHKDYRFAGNVALSATLEPVIVEDIGMDSAHAHRFPLWLRSLRGGAEALGLENPYDRILVGFAQQFSASALILPADPKGVPMLNNYLSGHNGVYRYQYETLGLVGGYSAHELSYVLLQGWYPFLGEPFRPVVFRLRELFPLSSSSVSFYLGPDTSRLRHPLVSSTAYYRNGMAEVHVNAGIHVVEYLSDRVFLESSCRAC